MFHHRTTRVSCARFLSARPASWLTLILFSVVTLTPASGQDAATHPKYQGSRGSKARPAAIVPFTPGPFGPDGKVYKVVPDAKARRFPNEVETPQEREAATRAALGLSISSTKTHVNVLQPDELSLLNWAPNLLDPSHNPFLSTELFKSAEEKTAFHLSKPGSPSSQPAKGKDFPGFGDTTWFPPDGGIAAGPIQLVEVVNSSINVYDKNGNLLSSQTLNNFFSGLGTPGSDFLYDPSVYYDQESGRFWVLGTSDNNSPNRSHHLVGVSASSDVTQGWFIYYMDATFDGSSSTNNWCDYPHMGMDADAIYVSCNQFSFPTTNASFQYAKVRIVTKDQFINDACCTWWDFYNLKEGFLNLSTAMTVRPALERWVGFGFGNFWVDAEGSGGSGDTINVWQVTNPTACCDGSGGPGLNSNEQGVGSYDSAPAAQQPNGVAGLDTGGTRVLFAVYQFGHLSLGQTISDNSRAAAAFTEIDVSGYPTMSNINDWVFGVANEDIYYPFVDANANDDKTMVYTRSDGSSTYPGAYYAGIPRSSTCTSCLDSEVTMATGQANYLVLDSSGRNRWGDYQGASNDTDFLGIWVQGEYVASSNSWAKEINSSYNSYNPINSPSPTSIAFGNQAIFSSAATQYVTFTNQGNATLYTYSTQITGDSDFHITFDGCSFQTLQPGNACSEGVSFTPNSLGAGTGFILVYDNTSSTFHSSTLTGTGVKAATSTSIGSSLNPSTFGQTVKFTAHVFSTTTGTPGGTVTFYNGATAIGTATLSAGAASVSTSALAGGTHAIKATYNGGSVYLTSSGSITQTVDTAPSSTKVVSSKNPSTHGQPVTFTATVTSGVSTPGGTVTFKSGATSIGSGLLSGGHVSLTTSSLTGGTHSITAVYGGTTNFTGSTSPAITQTVNKATTTTTVSSSVHPSSYHQTVTFTAKVTSGGGIPAGTVTFKNGGVALGTVNLNATGVATLSTNALTVASHAITAVYGGNVSFITSTSPALTQVVTKASTTAALVSSKNPSTHGTSVTFTVTITPAFGGTATGTVTFKNGTATMGTGTVNASNKASFTTSALAVGTHSITAVYPGDTHFTTSTSPVLKQVVQ
jgi:hypothetical protein